MSDRISGSASTTRASSTSRTRKRMRMETVTPNKTRRSGAGLLHAVEDAVAETKIVWKDSPVEKQIKVSGTGKLAVRKEMQGFVGRLARASIESPQTGADASELSSSPPDHHSTRDHLFNHAFGKRKAAVTRGHDCGNKEDDEHQCRQSAGINKGAHPDTDATVSRHLFYSPESGNARKNVGTPPRHTNYPLQRATSSAREKNTHVNHAISPTTPPQLVKSDSQDELLLILDNMDKKYSSQDEPLPASKPTPAIPVVRAATVQQSSVSSSNRVAAVSPSVAAPVSYASSTASFLDTQVLQYLTPETNASAETEELEDSPECGSPLTEESWDLLDQLEFQATQRISASQEAGHSHDPQVTPPPLAPIPSSMAKQTYSNNRSPAPEAHSEMVTPGREARRSASGNVRESDYKRFLVLEVDCDMYHRRLVLRLLDEQENHIEAVLADDWFDTMIEAGDTINIVFTERESTGLFSQVVVNQGIDSSSRTPNLTNVIQVDNEHNIVILHPDVLVSPTSVTTSFGCLRRAILRETLNVNRPTNQKAFLGTLKHNLFEKSLLQGEFSAEFLLREAHKIVYDNILGLVECGLDEQTTLLEMKKVIEDYRKWLVEALGREGVALNEPPPGTGARVKIHKVLATEEMMWSIKWGLKGATDASVEATFLTNAVGVQAEKVVLPLELKTGSKVYAGVEHQGQVILYTLLLNERYRQRCQDGLLMYVPGIETNRIAAMATHIRGLIIARNKFASSMAKVKALGSSSSSQIFPPMLRSRRDCERCFQIDECVLHHAAVENGTEESSGLEDVFTNKTGHLSGADLSYFKLWNRMIDLEQQHAEKNLRALWLQVGWKREQARGDSSCIASLSLVLDEPAFSDRGTSRMLRFQRDPRRKMDLGSQLHASSSTPVVLLPFLELGFRVDDQVILSAESLDGTKLLVHIARAKIVALEPTSITVEAYQSIPSIVAAGKSTVGKDFTWRLDKNAIITGLNRAKENLVRLFIGPPPELTKIGTCGDSRPEIKALQSTESNPSSIGDTRRRNLIVHLDRPRFKPCRVSELLMQRCKIFARTPSYAEINRNGKVLLDHFFRLNTDQQRAVQKVLSSVDYALVLGMPGTGKTSTISFAVRVLLFLGFSVLVTSYTHSAVDNLLLKLLEFKLPMLRIGNPSHVHPQLADFTLERQAATRGVNSVREMESLMQIAQLVGCTCLSVNSHILFRKRRFDFCIVDEATQTTQPVVLGALHCADTFVLVGDHYQLPPLVASAQARKEGMDVSLFRRLSEAHPAAVQQLSFQYRMNADIMVLANRLVYGGKLKCGSFQVASNHLSLNLVPIVAKRQHHVPWPAKVLSSNQGVMFVDTDSLDQASESATGPVDGVGKRGRKRMENVVEAQVIVALVELLLHGGVNAQEVAVISPFRSQVSLISRHLAEALTKTGFTQLSVVEVSTIDKYQGKDKDVMLVSFVRSNEENHVGELLMDWRRINVALTRAKQKLLLVGSLSTLGGGSPLFSVLSQAIKERQWQLRLAKDALTELDEYVQAVRNSSIAMKRSEPDPERDEDSLTQDGYSEVSVLHPSGDNEDIEGLVRSISSVNHITRRPGATALRVQQAPLHASHPQLKPITRDILGEM
uniref:DNA replication ATP-dependent helicase/nuclease n=1 Tax=Globisporangium ultimum (strain ATCC 200006 / CBS 805.95 / DAOM BR144) TaxID=431595 RepID=K3X802_GLOUD